MEEKKEIENKKEKEKKKKENEPDKELSELDKFAKKQFSKGWFFDMNLAGQPITRKQLLEQHLKQSIDEKKKTKKEKINLVKFLVLKLLKKVKVS